MQKFSLIFLLAFVFAFNIQAEIYSPHIYPDDLPLCQFQGTILPLTSGTILGFSGEDVLSGLISAASRTLIWGNGEKTSVGIDFSPTTKVARIISYYGSANCTALKPQLVIDGNLSIITSDGKVNAIWPVSLLATSASEAEVKFSIDGKEGLQGIPGPEEHEIFPQTHFQIKFQDHERHGLIHRNFITNQNCWADFTLCSEEELGRSSANVATILALGNY